MPSDKELYNRYQNEIMDYELFKSMTDKKLKTLLFRGWISKFGGKKIRDTMGITYSTWDYNNRTFGSAAKDNKEKEEPKKPDRIDVTNYEKPYIDAEFEVVATKNETSIAISNPNSEEEAVKKEKKLFIGVEWTNDPQTIKAQLEAIANVLLFEKGEIMVRLDVFK